MKHNKPKNHYFTYPLCPSCNTKLQLNDYYGKNKTVRYKCPNQECKLITISQKTLDKIHQHTVFWLDIYEILLHLFGRSLPTRNKSCHILGKSYEDLTKITDNIIKSLYKDKNIIKSGIKRVELSEKNFSKIIKEYNRKNPIISFIPLENEIICCATYQNEVAERIKLSENEKTINKIIEKISLK